MTKYDLIYEEAIDNFGLITSAKARELGITNNELVQYARRGKLEHVGQGLYRIVRRVPEPNDSYALSVALVGPNAYLYGESVLAMLGLLPVNPICVYVATPKRVRRDLPDDIVVIRNDALATMAYDGIPSQAVADAIRSCEGKVMPERIGRAIEEARLDGYLTQGEYDELMEDVTGHGKAE